MSLLTTAIAASPAASAAPPPSCTVSTPGGTCLFSCLAGQYVSVSAGGLGLVSISGSCGTATAQCTRAFSCSDVSDAKTTAAGTGVCRLDAGSTGTCGAGAKKGASCSLTAMTDGIVAVGAGGSARDLPDLVEAGTAGLDDVNFAGIGIGETGEPVVRTAGFGGSISRPCLHVQYA